MSTKFKSYVVNTLFVTLSVVILLALIEVGSYVVLKSDDSGFYERNIENSLGLRETREPGEIRAETVILALGDSFTYGWGVQLEDSYPAQLEASLHSATFDVAVVNAGEPGFDTQMAYDRLRAIYDQYEPDFVILGFHSADIIQNQTTYAKMTEEDSGQEVTSLQDREITKTVEQREADIPFVFLIKEYLRQRSSTAALVNYYYMNNLIKYFPPPEAVKKHGSGSDFEATEHFLDEINGFLSDKEAELILLSIVPLIRFDAYPYDQLNERLEEYARSRDIMFINPLTKFSDYSSEDFWVSMEDGHYNALGNRIVMEVLKEALIEHRLEISG
jgi:hypothetical protein